MVKSEASENRPLGQLPVNELRLSQTDMGGREGAACLVCASNPVCHGRTFYRDCRQNDGWTYCLMQV